MTQTEIIDKIAGAIAVIEGFYDSPAKCKKLGNPYPNIPQRNNNPGNVWDGLGKGKVRRIWPSMPIDGSGFVIYPSVEAGFAALKNDIKIKISRGMTLAQIIYMYAPPSENNTKAYLEGVAKSANLPIDKPLEEIK